MFQGLDQRNQVRRSSRDTYTAVSSSADSSSKPAHQKLKLAGTQHFLADLFNSFLSSVVDDEINTYLGCLDRYIR